MVGWSSRNSRPSISPEEAAKRKAEWDALPEDEKARRKKTQLKADLFGMAVFVVFMGVLWPTFLWFMIGKPREDYAKIHGPCLAWSQHMVGPVIASRCDKWSK